jgi:hypothetical protein
LLLRSVTRKFVEGVFVRFSCAASAGIHNLPASRIIEKRATCPCKLWLEVLVAAGSLTSGGGSVELIETRSRCVKVVNVLTPTNGEARTRTRKHASTQRTHNVSCACARLTLIDGAHAMQCVRNTHVKTHTCAQAHAQTYTHIMRVGGLYGHPH